MHYNWLQILEKIKVKLLEFYGIESTVGISKKGYAQLFFAKKDSIKILYKASTETLSMNRKWDKLKIFF